MVINLFITAVFAAGYYGRGLPDIGLQSAGHYLGETYGQAVRGVGVEPGGCGSAFGLLRVRLEVWGGSGGSVR